MGRLSTLLHRLPPSWLIHRPPSSPVTTCLGLFGSIQTSWSSGWAVALSGGEALAAVHRHDQVEIGLEQPVGVGRIDDQVGEVERSPDHVLAAVALGPGLAAVVGDVERAVGRLDERIDPIAVAGREGDGEAAPGPLGQALGVVGVELGPRLAAVRGAVQRAAGGRVRRVAARAERPALAAEVPRAGEQDVRVLRIHGERRAAGRQVRALQDQAPGLAAVGRLVEAAVGAVAPQLARHADVDDVAVAGIDQNFGDVLGVRQAHVGPGLAAVGGLVDPVADRDGVAHPGLAGADPDGVGMGGIDRDGADRLRRLLVEDRLEGRAAVLGLPHAAARPRRRRGRGDRCARGRRWRRCARSWWPSRCCARPGPRRRRSRRRACQSQPGRSRPGPRRRAPGRLWRRLRARRP